MSTRGITVTTMLATTTRTAMTILKLMIMETTSMWSGTATDLAKFMPTG
jgi:hypothetical protein